MHDQYCGTNKFSYAIVSYHFLEETQDCKRYF